METVTMMAMVTLLLVEAFGLDLLVEHCKDSKVECPIVPASEGTMSQITTEVEIMSPMTFCKTAEVQDNDLDVQRKCTTPIAEENLGHRPWNITGDHEE
jgi:hypothetical protein